jgi:hypothetical protein
MNPVTFLIASAITLVCCLLLLYGSVRMIYDLFPQAMKEAPCFTLFVIVACVGTFIAYAAGMSKEK